tara:strand:- start:173 stop:634 length:462 start_codon:yes stop_codon:yes gene_type:complete
MIEKFNEILNFHKTKGGTGKIFKFKFLEYKEGYLKLEAEFPIETLNPNGSVQGGMMTSMLDDITSLLIIYESQGIIYPNSTNLHSLHHRPLFKGKVIATAEVVKKGKNIATVKGEIYNSSGKLATTLMHTVVLMKSEYKKGDVLSGFKKIKVR